jgi:hypothetical protein
MGHAAVWGARDSDGASALGSGKTRFKFRKIQKEKEKSYEQEFESIDWFDLRGVAGFWRTHSSGQ